MQRQAAVERENGRVDAMETMIDGYLERVRTDEGVALLVDELHAGLAPKIPDLLTSAHAALARLPAAGSSGVVDSQLSAQVQRIREGVQEWLDTVDFSERARLKRALQPLVEALRKHNLHSTQAITALELDQLLAFGRELMAATKQGLVAYEVEVDPFLQAMSAGLSEILCVRRS